MDAYSNGVGGWLAGNGEPLKVGLKPFVELLRQGVSPEKIALTIALGIILGVIPMLGSTVLLCTLAAIAFRLNLPAIQLVNGVVYPLQFILLIPFYRLGAWMFGTDASAISLHGVAALIRSGVGQAIRTLWVVTMHALVAWLALGSVASVMLYAALVPLLRHLWTRVQARRLNVVSPEGILANTTPDNPAGRRQSGAENG